jgi:hypothetical protein
MFSNILRIFTLHIQLSLLEYSTRMKYCFVKRKIQPVEVGLIHFYFLSKLISDIMIFACHILEKLELVGRQFQSSEQNVINS